MITIFGSFFLSREFGEKHLLDHNLTVNVFLQAAAVFVWIKSMYSARAPVPSNRQAKIVRAMSAYSLGIYAMHDAVIKLLQAFFASWAPFQRAWVQIPIVLVVSLAVSCLVSALLHRLPFFKKIV